MTLKIKTLTLGVGILALAACGEGPAGKTWNQEAGSFIDEGGFGNPTMTNMMAQMCRGKAKGYIVPDPIVSLDPASPKGAPAYRTGRVMCSGHLNGQYAQVIWSGYVSSAVPASTLGSAPGDIGGG